MKDKTCNSCYVKKGANDFSAKQAICKSCRAVQATTQNHNKRLEERKENESNGAQYLELK